MHLGNWRERRRLLFSMGLLIMGLAATLTVTDIRQRLSQECHPLHEHEYEMHWLAQQGDTAGTRVGGFDSSVIFFADRPFELEIRCTSAIAEMSGAKTSATIRVAPHKSREGERLPTDRQIVKIPSHARSVGYRAYLRCTITMTNGVLRVCDEDAGTQLCCEEDLALPLGATLEDSPVYQQWPGHRHAFDAYYRLCRYVISEDVDRDPADLPASVTIDYAVRSTDTPRGD